MKTKIEINGVEVEIEATENLLTIKVEKDDETIEEFEISTGEEGEEDEGEEAEGGEVKAFDEFEEEEDFDEVPAGAEEEVEEEQFEESAKLESFTSYLAKQTKK